MGNGSLIARLRGVAVRYLNSVYESLELQRELVTFLEHESWRRTVSATPYDDPRRLAGHGYRAFSESDEDGIIAEIFRRIGAGSRTFFEFGVGDGLANNTVNLLIGGWRGFWIDGSENFVRAIDRRFARYKESGQLSVLHSFITRDNVNDLIGRLKIPESIDILSIDIDGNDYWIWQAINAVSPRVVVIEYNSTLRPPRSLVMEYKDDNTWDGTSYFGASLSALEKLGREKGYALVGCNYTGVNAFFVRADLTGDHFLSPFSAEIHYEPPKRARMIAGHPAGIGPWVEV